MIHYKSCQDWPEIKANIHIDYFFKGKTVATNLKQEFDNTDWNYLFKAPDFQQGVKYDDELVPIAAVVEGYVGIVEEKGILVGTKFRNEYNYFQFRSEVQKRKDLFSVN